MNAPVEIDLEALGTNLIGSRTEASEFLIQLVDIYLSRTPETIAELTQAYAAVSREEVSRAAHSLKAASAALGVRKVAVCCAEIESDWETISLVRLENLVSEINRSYAAAAAELVAIRDHYDQYFSN